MAIASFKIYYDGSFSQGKINNIKNHAESVGFSNVEIVQIDGEHGYARGDFTYADGDTAAVEAIMAKLEKVS
jgi:glutamate formiminotransferase